MVLCRQEGIRKQLFSGPLWTGRNKKTALFRATVDRKSMKEAHIRDSLLNVKSERVKIHATRKRSKGHTQPSEQV
jgi:hypothetical protein